jgi:twitching motility protein PilT
MSNLHQLLKQMVERGASDLHVTVGSPPMLRIDGRLTPVQMPALTGQDTRQLCYSVLTDIQRQKFEEHNELDASFGVKSLSRFRANIYMQRGAVSGVFRQIPFRVRTFEELALPPVLQEFSQKKKGLVLVTGPTGSGKSTTLAAMIDKINTDRQYHILTIEDPIEFLHPHKQSIVNQREVGSDTAGFKTALKYVLRQDPDVVLVGEMRDLETIEAAMSISETGHLCLATLHTNGAVQTINRIVDAFPSHQQDQVRAQLSFVLEGICSQQLIPKASGGGRVMSLEILVLTAAIRNLIREDKLHQVYSQMQVGQQKFGMQTMNQSLFSLLQRRLITVDEALGRSTDVDELKTMLKQFAAGTAPGQS